MNKRARILIVDHAMESLSNLYIKFLIDDYEVEASNDSGEILPRIHRFQPDLVILNKDLPGIDYVSVCRHLRQKNLPLILLLDQPQKECVLIDGCCIDEIITKPVQVDKLFRKITELTSKR